MVAAALCLDGGGGAARGGCRPARHPNGGGIAASSRSVTLTYVPHVRSSVWVGVVPL
jgi:hypothetical protein